MRLFRSKQDAAESDPDSVALVALARSLPWQMLPERLAAMLSALEDGTPAALTLRPGKRRDDLPGMTMRDSVAVIPIDGPLFRQADWFIRWFGGIATADLARQFQLALDDPAVQSILFVIDSPGGEVTGIGELSDAIYAARGRKPVWAYIEGEGASAAYHLASAASRVVMSQDAMVGSIGTVLVVPDPTKRYRSTIDFVSSQSPRKRPDVTTDAGRAEFQALVDDMTEVFVQRVARNRGMPAARVLAPRGALLVGQKAIDAGLADGFSSEEQAIRALVRRAGSHVPGIRAQQQEERTMGSTTDRPAAPAPRLIQADMLAGLVEGAQLAGITLPPPPPPRIAPARTLEQRLEQITREVQMLTAPRLMPDARRRELLAMTALGQAALPGVERRGRREARYRAAHPEGVSIERRRYLLGLTPLGQVILQREMREDYGNHD